MTFRSLQVFQVSCVSKKKKHVIDIQERKLFIFLCMFLKDWIKLLGPCSVNRSIESTYEIIKVIDNIQQDNAIVVIVSLNHEVICIS